LLLASDDRDTYVVVYSTLVAVTVTLVVVVPSLEVPAALDAVEDEEDVRTGSAEAVSE
jgi:hypothetical protein